MNWWDVAQPPPPPPPVGSDLSAWIREMRRQQEKERQQLLEERRQAEKEVRRKIEQERWRRELFQPTPLPEPDLQVERGFGPVTEATPGISSTAPDSSTVSSPVSSGPQTADQRGKRFSDLYRFPFTRVAQAREALPLSDDQQGPPEADTARRRPFQVYAPQIQGRWEPRVEEMENFGPPDTPRRGTDFWRERLQQEPGAESPWRRLLNAYRSTPAYDIYRQRVEENRQRDFLRPESPPPVSYTDPA